MSEEWNLALKIVLGVVFTLILVLEWLELREEKKLRRLIAKQGH